MKKIIINVGRQIGSGGRIVAKMLAERFGCTFYDNELLCLAAKNSGFCEEVFAKNDEHRGFFRSMFHLHTPFVGDNNFYQSRLSQEGLFKIQSDAIRKAASEGSCVFVGRCADYVLRDMGNMVNVFVTANMTDRVRHVVEREKCSEEAARKLIESGEHERAAYYNYYTGKRWGDSSSYDLCVNTSRLGLEGTVEFVAEFVEKSLYTPNGDGISKGQP